MIGFWPRYAIRQLRLGVSYQLSVISYQLSAISYQRLALLEVRARSAIRFILS